MKIELVTYRCGAGEGWWTYSLLINSEIVNPTTLIYRMYSKEKTAINNGLRLLNKTLKKAATSKR